MSIKNCLFLTKKTSVGIFLSLCIFLSMLVFSRLASAEEKFGDAVTDPALPLRVELFDGEGAYTEVQKLPGYPGEPFVLFFPADCDRTSLKVSFDCSGLSVNGEKLVPGEPTGAFAKDGDLTVTTPEGEYTLKVMSSARLPSVFITTESGGLDDIHADKTYKEAASLTVVEAGTATLDGAELSYIKGRGNSSWRSNEKRSYNIKFKDKQALFGMEPAKKWALVSNNMDSTLMHNFAAYVAAKETAIPYNVDFAFVDLYINGSYRGNYSVTEKIEIGEGRVEEDDLDKANEAANPDTELKDTDKLSFKLDGKECVGHSLPNLPEDISGCYILEYEYDDALMTEESVFSTRTGSCLIIQSPEYAAREEVEYVAGIYDKFESALLSKTGKNSDGKSYLDFIDADSFVDCCLLYEYLSYADKGYSSLYLLLPKGSDKFVMGPIWDFDQSMQQPDKLMTCVQAAAAAEYYGRPPKASEQPTLFRLLCSHEDFLSLMKERSPYFCSMLTERLLPTVKEVTDLISSSRQCDAFRWGYELSSPGEVSPEDFITARAAFVAETLSSFDAAVSSEKDNIREGRGTEYKKPGTWKIAVAAAACVAAGACLTVVLLRKKKKSASAKKK